MHDLQYISMLDEQKELYRRNHAARGQALAYIVEKRAESLAPKYNGDTAAAREAVIKDISTRVGVDIDVVRAAISPEQAS